MTRIAFVHGGTFYHLACLADPALIAYDVTDCYAPDLRPGDLDEFDAIYVAARLHPRLLASVTPLILTALSRPGVRVAIDGENQVGSWLPGTSEEPRGTNFWAWRTGEDVGRRSVNQGHPMWDYLSESAVHWHYHGVLAPPAGAQPLVVLQPVGESRADPWAMGYTAIEDHPNVVMYHDAETFAGEVLVSTMDAAYHHGSGFMPGATQLLYRQLRWLADAA